MYLDYFNLTESPFQTSADPKFLWVGKQHQHVLGALENSLLENQGVFVLTGDIGTGKTALIHAFVKSFGSKTFRAVLSYPEIGKIDFFNFLAGSFYFPVKFNTDTEFFRYFASFLRIACKFTYRIILIIDEADKLSDEIFDQILYFTEQGDLQLVPEGAPAFLLLFDGLVKSAPENAGLLLGAANAQSAYAAAFLGPEEGARARDMYAKARDYGLRTRRQANRRFDQVWDRPLAEFETALPAFG